MKDSGEIDYTKVCEWCWKNHREPPEQWDKDALKRTAESMKTLGYNPYK